MIALALSAAVLVIATVVAGFWLRGRIRALEAAGRVDRADLIAEKAEVARLRAQVESRLAVLEERERGAAARDDDARELLRAQWSAVYRQAKGQQRAAMRIVQEARRKADQTLAEVDAVRDDFAQQYRLVYTLASDTRVNRLLNERVVPQIPEQG